MDRTVAEFIEIHRELLINALEDYLSKNITTEALQSYASQVIDDWNSIPNASLTEPYIKGEKVLWAIVWAIISYNHWNERDPSELPIYLDLLRHNADLPPGYEARRPQKHSI